VWTVLGLLFLALVVVKAGSLVAKLSDVARGEVQADGMYEGRRPWQVTMVALAAGTAVVQISWCMQHVTERWKRYRWTILGAGTIICFGLIRAVSLHELDAMKGLMTAAKVLVELVASGVAAWGAVKRIGELRRRRDETVIREKQLLERST